MDGKQGILSLSQVLLSMNGSLARRRSETRGPEILGLSISFTILATICVLLRVYTRRVILHTFGAEDVAIVIAQIFSICVTVIAGLRMFSSWPIEEFELTLSRGTMGPR